MYFHHKCMRYDTCNTVIILPNPTLKTSNGDTHLRCPQPSGDAQTYSCGSIWVTWLSCRGSPGKSSVHRIPHKDHGWCTGQIWGKVEKGEGQDEVAARHWVCCHIFSHAAVTRVHNFFYVLMAVMLDPVNTIPLPHALTRHLHPAAVLWSH